MDRLRRTAIRLVGPLILVLLVLKIGDPKAIGETLASASLAPLGLTLVLTVVCSHFKVLRWTALLRRRGVEYPVKRAWTSFLSSVYAGMLTPGRVGDVLRVQYLRHDVKMPYAEGLAIVVMDRICDLYVLVGFVAVGVVRFSQVLVGKLAVIMWGGVALTVLGPLLLFIPGVAEKLMGRVYEKLAQKVGGERSKDGLSRFLAALRAQVGPGLAQSLLLTLAAFLTNYAQGWLIARSLHLSIAFYDVVCLLAIASLLGLLPISVSGVGVRELFFALVFPVLGYSKETGVSFGLLVFLTIYLAVVALGFVSWQIAPPPTGDAARTPPGA
jgi:uncharacterized protein (TIRG00374 family)